MRVVELPQVVQGRAPTTPTELVPAPPALEQLVPGGGLWSGSVTAVEGSLMLALALTAGLGTRWCAIVGIPELNPVAIAAMRGLPCDRGKPLPVLMVDDPGRRWADAVAALSEACPLVLARPPALLRPQVARRVTTLARSNGCVLVIAGPWDGAGLRLRIEESQWAGLGDGHGHLRGRRALVTASGRGAAAGGRRAWLWLPGPDGTITAADDGPARPAAIAG